MNKRIADRYWKIINRYGAKNQILQAMEELAELIQALNKNMRDPSIDNHNHVLEEIADVQVMLDQLKLIFDQASNNGSMAEYEINEIMIAKIMRQIKRIEEGEK